MKAKTRCSYCCRCHDILAPRRWLTWSSKCTNTFPTNALRPSNHHFKRASGSEGRHAAHKRRCPPRATQGCADAEAKKQRNAIALIACALPRSTTKRTAPCECEVPVGKRPYCSTGLFCARTNDDGKQHGAAEEMSMAGLKLASSRLRTTRQDAGESENRSIP